MLLHQIHADSAQIHYGSVVHVRQHFLRIACAECFLNHVIQLGLAVCSADDGHPQQTRRVVQLLGIPALPGFGQHNAPVDPIGIIAPIAQQLVIAVLLLVGVELVRLVACRKVLQVRLGARKRLLILLCAAQRTVQLFCQLRFREIAHIDPDGFVRCRIGHKHRLILVRIGIQRRFFVRRMRVQLRQQTVQQRLFLRADRLVVR